MSFVKLTSAAVAATLMATPAFAQSDEAETNFTGLKVAVIAGYESVNVNVEGLDHPTGAIAGATAGYDLQVNEWVVGVEGEVTGATTKIKGAGTTLLSAGRDLYAGARIGFVQGSALFYVKAGYSNARINAPIVDHGADFGGFRVGAGAEKQFGDKLYAKIEYRYSGYEEDTSRQQIVGGVGVRF